MSQKTLVRQVLFGRIQKAFWLCVFVAAFVGVSVFFDKPTPVQAAPSNTINFQARLLTSSGTVVPDGYYNVEFKLYNTSSGGSALWTETYYDQDGSGGPGIDGRLRVVNGYLTVNLNGFNNNWGSITDWSEELWLTMNIGGRDQNNPTWDGEMSPRLKLTAVPYAFEAANADRLGGVVASSYARLDQNQTFSGHNVFQPTSSSTTAFQLQNAGGQTIFNFDSSNNRIGIGTNNTSPTYGLDVTTTVGISIGSQAALVVKDSIYSSRYGFLVDTVNYGIYSNYDVTLENTANSETAFQVQDANAANTLFKVDADNNRVVIGDGDDSEDANTTLLVVDSASTANLPIGVNGGIIYDSEENKFKIFENGEWKTLCNATDASCGGNASTLQDAYDASTNPEITVDSTRGALTVRDASSAIGANLFEVQDNAGTVNYLSVAADGTTIRTGTNSATGFQIQNADGKSLLNVDTANSVITLNGNVSGEPRAWASTTVNLTNGGIGARDNAGAVTYNGYIYVIGGDNGSSVATSIAYHKIDANGDLTGNWATTGTNVPARTYHAVTQANGYLYILGGSSSASSTDVKSEVYYAKINADGTVGSFATTTPLPAGRKSGSAAALNGYMYYVGGDSSSNATPSAVYSIYYAKINADGTVGSWNTVSNATNGLPQQRYNTRVVAANGYIYSFGGQDSGNGATTTVYYARPNSSGNITSVMTSETINPLPAQRFGGGVYVANGYVYYVGGANNSGVIQPTVYYAPLNANGSLGAWAQQDTANDLPAARVTFSYAAANGYFYAIGGYNTSAQSTSYYTSVSRVVLGSGLDLVGLSGEDLADGGSGTGGELTAGNTNVIGQLNVRGSAAFAQSVSIGGTLSVSNQTHIALNTSDTNRMPLVVEQSGTGDSGIEIKNNAQSYYVGLDASDGNKFKISSSTAAGAQDVMGNSTISGIPDEGITNVIGFGKVVAPVSGTVTTLKAYVQGSGTSNNKAQMAIYSDNSGAPGGSSPLTISDEQTISSGSAWYTFTLASPLTVSSNTTYWLAYTSNGENNVYYYSGVLGDSAYKSHTYSTGSFPEGSGHTITGAQRIMYAVIDAPGASSDHLAISLLEIGPTGQAVFRNSEDSSSAFQIQNASADTLFNVDTDSGTISVLNGSSGLHISVDGSDDTTIEADGDLNISTDANINLTGDEITITTTTVFEIQDSLGGTLLSADAATGNIGIGTSSPSAKLEVAVNSSSTVIPSMIINQANAEGDVTLQFQNSGNDRSFYVGQDASGGDSFVINSGFAASGADVPQFVQSASSGYFSTDAYAYLSDETTAGNALVAAVTFSSPATTFECSNGVDTFTTVAVTIDTDTGRGQGICYGLNIAGGADYIMASFDDSSLTSAIAVAEYTNILEANAFDGSASSLDGATSGITTGGAHTESFTTTTDGNLIFGAFTDLELGTNMAPAGTATMRDGFSEMMIQDQVQLFAGSINAAATFDDDHKYIATVIALKATTSGYTDTYRNALFSLSQSGQVRLRNRIDSSSAFQIQNALGDNIITASTSTGLITIGEPINVMANAKLAVTVAHITQALRVGNVSGGLSFDTLGSGKFRLYGDARNTKKLVLTPEYAGAVLDGSGTGTMTAAYDSTQRKNYYKWTTSQGTSQTYDIVITMSVPSDWAAWAASNAISVDGWTSNTSNSTGALTVIATDGTTDVNATSITPGSTSTWTTTSANLTSAKYNADGTMVIRLSMTAQSSSSFQLGNVTLTYLSQF